MIDLHLLGDLKHAEDDKHIEGTNFIAYRDTRGFWTIGYGHLLDQTIDWSGHEITQAAADGLLSQDVEARTSQVIHLPEWASLDTPCRQNALVECVFNLGQGHWISEFPKTRDAIKAKLWTAAGANLLKSPEWIREVGLKRVARLAGYLADGSYSQ